MPIKLNLWILRVLLTVFGGIVCCSILVVLVFAVKLNFALFQSYLSNRYLYVVANAQESSQYPIQAGMPRVQFGHQYFSTYMFGNYHYKFIIVILSVIVMILYY